MKSKSLILSFTLSLCVFAGCAKPWGYQALERGYGYSDQSVDPSLQQVSYQGDTRTSIEQVEDYLLLRMAELASERGADQFSVVDRETVCVTTLQTSPTSTCTYRQAKGEMFPYFVKDLDKPWFRRLSPEQRYEATAFVSFIAHPACDEDPNCYTTQSVLAQLEALPSD